MNKKNASGLTTFPAKPEKPLQLSPTMVAVMTAICAHGDLVERWPGGFWTWPGCPAPSGVPQWFCGSTTINALVARGRLEVTERKEARHGGSFPVKAKVVQR